MPVNVMTCAAAWAAAWLAAAGAIGGEPGGPATGEGGAGTVLLGNGFEEGLAGWAQEGRAEFAADAGKHHGGKLAARITIAPGVKTQYQQLQHQVMGVSSRDRVTAAAWVRTRDVSDGAGAYIVLEFLGANGQRVDIAHSKVARGNGKDGWERLEAEAVVPVDAATTRLALVFHSHGTAWFDDAEVAITEKPVPWPDLGDARREVMIHTDRVVQTRFGGVGFHVFDHVHDASQEFLDEVLEKRWRELNPSFARLNHHIGWDRATLDRVAARMVRMQQTGSEMYLATWDPREARTAEELAAYSRRVVDSLEYLVRTKGLTNIREFCMANELSLNGWGTLRDDLPRFRAYHQALFDELKARKLEIRLLATDAAPIGSWYTLEWAAENMDAITGIYGGHHYIQEYAPEDERFYPWFLSKMQWGADLARKHGKEFILGEFGCKQAPPERTVNGKKMDTCVYWDTPQEPLVSLQLAEAVIAAIQGGVYATAYWTYADFPDEYRHSDGVPESKVYANKWGVFRRSGNDYSTRAHYYAYGLLTKFFRGPATVYQVSVNDPRLRVAAVEHHGTKTWSVAVVNRNSKPVPVSIALGRTAQAATFRKYVYDPRNVPFHPFGDLQGPAGRVAMKDGRLNDTVGPLTLTVYTTAYDDDPPGPVQGLKSEAGVDGKRRLAWQANEDRDFCYYRVCRGERANFAADARSQIGSTLATQFTDGQTEEGREYHYKVLAVDMSGNASGP